jgi:hypothetical protein
MRKAPALELAFETGRRTFVQSRDTHDRECYNDGETSAIADQLEAL